MKKQIIQVLIISFLICGCTTTTNRFGNAYNEAVASGRSTTIFKEGDFSNIKDNVNDCFKNVGYEKVFDSSPQEGFMVVVKDIPLTKSMLIGDAHPYKIILKYTKAGEGQTRIDLVNGSPGLFSKEEVNKDIQRLTKLIKSDLEMKN